MIETQKKCRQITFPDFGDVVPQQPTGAQEAETQSKEKLPSFLHNVLFSSVSKVNQRGCPFSEYVHLKQHAWQEDEQSKNLIFLEDYARLMKFLDTYFEGHTVGIRKHVIITGTAGIGKTMFALYMARQYFERNELVVLHHRIDAWAFTKTDPSNLSVENSMRDLLPTNLYLTEAPHPGGGKYWYGQEELSGTNLDAWKRCGCAIIIRDPGQSKGMRHMTSKGREIYTVSSGQEVFFAENRKTGRSALRNQRTAALWSGENIMFAVKLGLIFLNSHIVLI